VRGITIDAGPIPGYMKVGKFLITRVVIPLDQPG